MRGNPCNNGWLSPHSVHCISQTGYKHGNGPELGSAALNNEDLAYRVLVNQQCYATDGLHIDHNHSTEADNITKLYMHKQDKARAIDSAGTGCSLAGVCSSVC